MENCPFSGQPCPHKKVTRVAELRPNGDSANLEMCQICTPKYLSLPAGATLKEPPPPILPKSCPGCGITLLEIASGGRVGCGECYSFFEYEMKVVASHSHGAVQHVGKVPANRPKNEKIKSLKVELAAAVAVENYEAAAAVKTKIQDLTSS